MFLKNNYVNLLDVTKLESIAATFKRDDNKINFPFYSTVAIYLKESFTKVNNEYFLLLHDHCLTKKRQTLPVGATINVVIAMKCEVIIRLLRKL